MEEVACVQPVLPRKRGIAALRVLSDFVRAKALQSGDGTPVFQLLILTNVRVPAGVDSGFPGSQENMVRLNFAERIGEHAVASTFCSDQPGGFD